MQYVRSTPNASGAYPAPRSTPFPGCLSLTDGQAETLVQYNGFVTITQEPDPEIETSTVTVTPDLEAWEAWKAAQPDPMDGLRPQKRTRSPRPATPPSWRAWTWRPARGRSISASRKLTRST